MASKNVGADIGNFRPKVAFKAVGSKEPEKCRSVRSILDVLTKEDVSDESVPKDNYFICTSSSSDWQGKGWRVSTDGTDRVMDSFEGKIKYALPLLVSTLWDDLGKKETLYVCVSVPRKDLIGSKVSDALTGTHTVKKGSDSKTVTIEVLGVFHEGVGVIVDQKPTTKENFLLEIGGDTLNGSAFHRLTTACPPYVLINSGGRCLISEVGNSEEAVIAANHPEGLSMETATTIVETPGHTVSLESGTIDFSDVVFREANKWLNRVVSEIELKCQHHLSVTNAKYVSGGPCLVPSVKEFFLNRGYQLVKEPLWGNAKGLLTRCEASYNQQNSKGSAA